MAGTYRDEGICDGYPRTQTLGELTKEPHFQRVPLRGLSQSGVEELIKLLAGFISAKTLVESVYSRTQGNALFVTEVVWLLMQEGAVGAISKSDPDQDTGASWSLEIPDGVKEAMSGQRPREARRCCGPR